MEVGEEGVDKGRGRQAPFLLHALAVRASCREISARVPPSLSSTAAPRSLPVRRRGLLWSSLLQRHPTALLVPTTAFVNGSASAGARQRHQPVKCSKTQEIKECQTSQEPLSQQLEKMTFGGLSSASSAQQKSRHVPSRPAPSLPPSSLVSKTYLSGTSDDDVLELALRMLSRAKLTVRTRVVAINNVVAMLHGTLDVGRPNRSVGAASSTSFGVQTASPLRVPPKKHPAIARSKLNAGSPECYSR